jgi:hypothetical protein
LKAEEEALVGKYKKIRGNTWLGKFYSINVFCNSIKFFVFFYSRGSKVSTHHQKRIYVSSFVSSFVGITDCSFLGISFLWPLELGEFGAL